MLPLQVTFHNMDHSDAVHLHIESKAQKLKTVYDRLTSCRVAVDVPQKHKHQGNQFSVRIDVTVPGFELVVNHVERADLYVAIRDAFDAAVRQLDELSKRQHHQR